MQAHHGRALSSRWLQRAFSLKRPMNPLELPVYLYPSFRSLSIQATGRPLDHPHPSHSTPSVQSRRLYLGKSTGPAATTETTHEPETPVVAAKSLPLTCSGCGALSQTVAPDQPGYFSLERKAVKKYLGLKSPAPANKVTDADSIIANSLASLDLEALKEQGIQLDGLLPHRGAARELLDTLKKEEAPLCERCQLIVHNNTGNSIYHPDVYAVRDTIRESPYKYNHVYHVLDAADFPLSLVPHLHALLDIHLRTQNRRSEGVKFRHGYQIQMSFIITRSDLLAPIKDQVDRLMPYLRDTLRSALGRVGSRVRLGNIHCVSASRSWWTADIRKEIQERGGANWLVGKANVGKSRLFRELFPSGLTNDAQTKTLPPIKIKTPDPLEKQLGDEMRKEEQPGDEADTDPSSLLPGHTLFSPSQNILLPPPQPETKYPTMPIYSSLPGTTASPIRIPFGNGRGELIDLPGLKRSGLEMYIREERRANLTMKARVTPEQLVIKPGQSLLIGGFIRLTPRLPNSSRLCILAHAFVPIEAHVTSTAKAVAVQTWAEQAPIVENLADPSSAAKIRHAGVLALSHNVTGAMTGPLLDKKAVGLQMEKLPFRVYGIDLLIEGVGWVQLTAQVRAKDLYGERNRNSVSPPPSSAPEEGKGPSEAQKSENSAWQDWLEEMGETGLAPPPPPLNTSTSTSTETSTNVAGLPSEWDRDSELNLPIIDVYSPEGKFVGSRKSMCASTFIRKKVTEGRPRKSMKGAKKMMKKSKRSEMR